MANRYAEFLVAPANTAPRSLPESIRQVGNLSAGFCQSWLDNELSDAHATSEEAFQLLDHIQNELLRHRDDHSKLPGWPSSPFRLALDLNIGQILDPASANDITFFRSLAPGNGAMPPSSTSTPLSLVAALNKLKHRSTSAVNFTVLATGSHMLYIFTNGGMGKQDSISGFDIHGFCQACKAAAGAI